MWLFVWNTTPSKVFLGEQQYSKVFVWDTKVRPATPVPVAEYIEYVIEADSYGKIYIPTCWYSINGYINCPYNWKVSIDGWTATTYSGTGGSNISLSWYTAGQEYSVKIEPVVEGYWWARAYWWYGSSWAGNLKSITYDGSYIWYGMSDTDPWNYFRYQQYRGCSKIESAPAEYLPNTVTSTWNSFRTGQYYGCSNLEILPAEFLPNSITTINTGFRNSQYYGCKTTSAVTECIPSSVTSISNYFRAYQYGYCAHLTTGATEVLPNSVLTIGSYFRQSMYVACTALTNPPAECLSSSITNIPNAYRINQYSGAGVTQMATEYMPNSVTSIWTQFKFAQYENCRNLVSLSNEVISNSLVSVGNSFRMYQFFGCTSLTTNATETFVDSATIWTGFREQQYSGCRNILTAYLYGYNDTNYSTDSYRYEQFKDSYSATFYLSWNVVDTGLDRMWTNMYMYTYYVPNSLLSQYEAMPQYDWWIFIWY